MKINCCQEQGQKAGAVMVLPVSLTGLIKSSVTPTRIHRTFFKATHTSLMLMSFSGPNSGKTLSAHINKGWLLKEEKRIGGAGL